MADANTHIQGKTLHFQHNSDSSQRQVMVRHHQTVNHHTVQIKQKNGNGRRNAHRKNSRHTVPFRQPAFHAESKHRLTSHPKQYYQKIGTGNTVGQAGSDSRSQHLAPVGQQNKHEERIQDNIQHAAQHIPALDFRTALCSGPDLPSHWRAP